jgi:hypothetical protein
MATSPAFRCSDHRVRATAPVEAARRAVRIRLLAARARDVGVAIGAAGGAFEASRLEHVDAEPASFVDERLSERHADLLFTIVCEGRQAYVYVLLEHQSTSDPLMAFHLLRYLVRIWEAFLVERPKSKRPRAIVPMVDR